MYDVKNYSIILYRLKSYCTKNNKFSHRLLVLGSHTIVTCLLFCFVTFHVKISIICLMKRQMKPFIDEKGTNRILIHLYISANLLEQIKECNLGQNSL